MMLNGLLFGLGWALAFAIVGVLIALMAWLFEIAGLLVGRFERWRWRRRRQ